MINTREKNDDVTRNYYRLLSLSPRRISLRHIAQVLFAIILNIFQNNVFCIVRYITASARFISVIDNPKRETALHSTLLKLFKLFSGIFQACYFRHVYLIHE